MAGIAFYFEDYDRDVYSGRRIDFDAWRYAALAAGDIDRMLVVNRTEEALPNPGGNIKLTEVDELPELDNAVYMATPWDTESEALWHFDHDVDWYVFGPAAGWAGQVPGRAVHIPQNGLAAFHSIHIASVVMMDRYRRVSWEQ